MKQLIVILASLLAAEAFAGHPTPAKFVSREDGVRIAYYPLLEVKSVPLFVLSGGPGTDSSYMRARGALDELARTRSLVLVDSAPPKLGDVTQLMEQLFPERIGEWRAKRATLGKHVTAADVTVFQSMEFVDEVALREFLDAVKDHRSNMDVNNALRRDMANRDYWDDVRAFTQPVLVVHGRFDAVIAPSDSWKLHQVLRNSRFQVIEAAGHLPHIERPQAFLAAVKPFLESLDR